MNNTYFNKNIFPDSSIKPINYISQKELLVEEILKLNKGKKATIYMVFPSAIEKEFKGILEVTGKDHITLSEPSTGNYHILPFNYIEYITFDENINYSWFFFYYVRKLY